MRWILSDDLISEKFLEMRMEYFVFEGERRSTMADLEKGWGGNMTLCRQKVEAPRRE